MLPWTGWVGAPKLSLLPGAGTLSTTLPKSAGPVAIATFATIVNPALIRDSRVCNEVRVCIGC